MTTQHLCGQTYHGRKGAVQNSFRYSIGYVLLDAEGDSGPALFSRNRANLAALHDTDHGGAPGQGRGAPWLREVLALIHWQALKLWFKGAAFRPRPHPPTTEVS